MAIGMPSKPMLEPGGPETRRISQVKLRSILDQHGTAVSQCGDARQKDIGRGYHLPVVDVQDRRRRETTLLSHPHHAFIELLKRVRRQHAQVVLAKYRPRFFQARRWKMREDGALLSCRFHATAPFWTGAAGWPMRRKVSFATASAAASSSGSERWV